MSELVQAFILGNGAILTNSCMLPLYPGLIAFLAGSANEKRPWYVTASLGFLVLAGILTMMVLIGLILFLINASFGDLFVVLLPVVYGLVILMGIGMIFGWNPFAKLATAQSPILRNPFITAYVYGLLFGPMTLPCTGPIILSAFALGAGDATELANGIIYFLFFGLGFGWPLVALSFVSSSLSRVVVGWLTRNHLVLTRVSGVILIAVGIFGILTELLPQSNPDIYIELPQQLLFWVVTIIVALVIGWFTYQRIHRQDDLYLQQQT